MSAHLLSILHLFDLLSDSRFLLHKKPYILLTLLIRHVYVSTFRIENFPAGTLVRFVKNTTLSLRLMLAQFIPLRPIVVFIQIDMLFHQFVHKISFRMRIV